MIENTPTANRSIAAETLDVGLFVAEGLLATGLADGLVDGAVTGSSNKVKLTGVAMESLRPR